MTGSTRPSTGPTSSRRRRHRASNERSCDKHWHRPTRETGRGPTRPPCSRLVESPSMSCPAIPPTPRGRAQTPPTERPPTVRVTAPAVLDRAASLLVGGPLARTGIGHDVHPFGPGEPLRLGG